MTRIAGLAYAVLMVAAVALMQNLSFMPSPAEAAAFFEARAGLITAGAYVGGLASFALIIAGVGIRSDLEDRGRPREGLAAFGGSIVAATLSLVGFGFFVVAAQRTTASGPIDPGVAAVVYDGVAILMGNAVPFGFAVTVGAFAVAGVGPRWLRQASGLFALALISPFNYVVVGLVVVWLPVIGYVLREGTALAVTRGRTT